MKIKNIIGTALLFSVALSSCDDFLDRKPQTNMAPEDYFTQSSHLAAYLDNYYAGILPSHGDASGTTGWDYGLYGDDAGTDNQVGIAPASKYLTGRWTVESGNGNWGFGNIMKMNLMFEQVLPKIEAGKIAGDPAEINHYLGEAYYLRAYEYFKKYREFGDYPVIDKVLPDYKAVLIDASKRKPRNEVARFILSELDKAAALMGEKNMAKTRISKDAALLLKSRVALFEGTWLKYFKGTAFVPQGDGWGGKTVDYNKDYAYPSGSIDNEIDFFLGEAMSASKEIADKYVDKLTDNTGVVQQSTSTAANLYMNMFGTENLEVIPEVVFWRQYSSTLVKHSVVYFAQRSNSSIGVTQGCVNSFLMTNGLPIYAPASGWAGDDIVAINATTCEYNTRKDRDPRLALFLKEPGQKNVLYDDGTSATIDVEPVPTIVSQYVTGYALRKGNSYYKSQGAQGGCYTGAILFRAAEALLNYMEASYERNGTVDADATKYWKALRTRAGVSDDFNATIAATDMNEEAKGDWGAYSAGQLLTDKTLYNIRRERRCEYLSEGFRNFDLYRWRSLDQLIATPFHPLGFKCFNANRTKAENGVLTYYTGPAVTFSDPAEGDYWIVFRKKNALTADGSSGLTWHKAHYLSPIGIGEIQITSPDGDAETSVIYQNPYWTLEVGSYAVE